MSVFANDPTAEARFWSMVERRSPDECWPWIGSTDTTGYGRLQGGSDGARRQQMAHRFSHELHIGPIPAGYEVDHRCHNADQTCPRGSSCLHRRCVNPAHLEAVTRTENIRRSPRISAPKCVHGHARVPENTRHRVRPGRIERVCLSCEREHNREKSKRRRAVAP